jgi:hypothetical protein
VKARAGGSEGDLVNIDASRQAELNLMLFPLGDVSARKMFGGRWYIVGDRLFAAFHKGVVATKLPDADREYVLDREIARPFTPTPGRRFGNWVGFPLRQTEDTVDVLPWLRKAFEYVQLTPPEWKRTLGRKG